MLKIFIEEEYGYRHWVWEYPNGVAALVADWRAGRAPLRLDKLDAFEFQGNVRRTTPFETKNYPGDTGPSNPDDWDASAHIHRDDDTHLEVSGIRYDGYPGI